MACHSQPKKKTSYPPIEGREVEMDASVPVEKMNSASSKRYVVVPVRRKMQHGEVYKLAPFMLQSDLPLLPCKAANNRKLKIRTVKIVVTAEELELLLSGSKRLHIEQRVARVRQSSGLRGRQNWLPSLPTIQEVQDY